MLTYALATVAVVLFVVALFLAPTAVQALQEAISQALP